MEPANKNLFKLGEMTIYQKQIFWKMKYCYAMIPIVQLLDGRTPPSKHRHPINKQKAGRVLQSARAGVGL